MDDNRRCTARSKRSGERCRKAAIRGGGVCAMHGGSAGQVRRAAQRRLVESEAVRLLGVEADIEPVTDPIASLALLAGEVQALKAVLRSLLGEVRAFDGADRQVLDRASALVHLYLAATERAEKMLTVLARLDLTDRSMTVDERTARGLVIAITATIEALGVRATQEEVSALMAVNLQAARIQVGSGFELGR